MTAKAVVARRREILTAWIVEHNLTQAKLADIQARIRDAALPEAEGWVPDTASIWRWLESLKAEAAAAAPAAAAGLPNAACDAAAPWALMPEEASAPPASGTETPGISLVPVAPAHAAGMASVPPLPAELTRRASRETVLHDIDQLEARAAALQVQLERVGPLSDVVRAMAKVQVKYMARMRRGETKLRGKFSDDGVWIRYEQMRDFNHQLLRALNDAPTPMGDIDSAMGRAPRRLPTVGGIVPVAGNALERAARRPSAMPFADTTTDRQLGADGLVAVTAGEPWGVTLAGTPRPHYGAVIEWDADDPAESDSLLRATLLSPVLTGGLSCASAADLWRKHFRRQTTAEEELLLPSMSAELAAEARARYHSIHVKTLEKWQRRVRAAEQAQGAEERASDHEGGTRVALSDDPAVPGTAVAIRIPGVLLHRNVISGRRRRALTPAMEAYIRQQYLMQDPDESPSSNAYALISMVKVSATTIRDELATAFQVKVGERTVQRFIAECISDADRIRHRGGPASAEIFRTRFIRQAKRPNQVWIMDHSFFKREKTEDAHPEWAPRSRDDMDFAWAFAREVHSIGQVATRRVVQKMSMTAIIDACTRRRLVLRVWEGTPSTEETLAALRDAILQFGVPEMLYTDNGSDLTSKRVLHVLNGLGIRKVHSMPYCPQGRGPIERDFRTIKEEILPLMPGFVSGSDSVRVDLTRLQDHATFERDLWRRVDRRLNYRKHDETGQKPAVHYDDAMAGRRFNVPTEEQLVALLCVEREVVRHSDGVHVLGGRYAGPGLSGIAEKSRVRVYIDAYRPAVGYVAAADHQGRQRFVGVVERYGQGGADAPQFDTHLAIEAEWTQESERALAVQARVAAARTAQTQLAARGDAQAERMVQDIQVEQERLTAATPWLVLPAAPDEAPDDHAPRPSAPSAPWSTPHGADTAHQVLDATDPHRPDVVVPRDAVSTAGDIGEIADVADGVAGVDLVTATAPGISAAARPTSAPSTRVAPGLTGEIASVPARQRSAASSGRAGDCVAGGDAADAADAIAPRAPKVKGTTRPRASSFTLPWASK